LPTSWSIAGLGEGHPPCHPLGELGDVLAVRGRVVVLRLDGARQQRQGRREGALQLLDQLRAVQRRAEAGGDRLDEHYIGLGERVTLGALEVQYPPDGPVYEDRHAQLRARVGAGVADDVIGVAARIGHQRADPGARDAAVDAAADRLLEEQELLHHGRQLPARGDEAQHLVVVQLLDRGEVEGEGLVELVDHQRRHLARLAGGGQARVERRRDVELGAKVGELAGGARAARADLLAMAPQRLGSNPALVGACTSRLGC
jgi:hypothetical protein